MNESPQNAPDSIEYAKADVNVARNMPGWLAVVINVPITVLIFILNAQPAGFWIRSRWISEKNLWYLVLLVSALSILLASIRFYVSRRHNEFRRGEWLAAAIVAVMLNVMIVRTIYPPFIHKHYNFMKCDSNLRTIRTAIALYGIQHAGAFPDSLERLIVEEGDLSDAGYALTCPISGDLPVLEKDHEKMAAAFAQHGHVSYLYFGKGLNQAAVPGNTLIACDKPHNHDNEGYDCLALFANGTIHSIPRPQLEKMIAARMAATIPSAATKKSTMPSTLPDD